MATRKTHTKTTATAKTTQSTAVAKRQAENAARADKLRAMDRAQQMILLATTPSGFDSVYSQRTLDKMTAKESISNSLLQIEDGSNVAGQKLDRKELRKTLSDDAISQAIETRRDAVVSTGWRLNAPDGANEEEIEYTTKAFERVRAPFLRAGWSAVPYGYGVTDVTFENDGPTEADQTRPERVRPSLVLEMPFENFSINKLGQLLEKNSQGEWEAVSEDTLGRKLFYTVRQPTTTNPLGSPLLAKVFIAWVLRTHAWDMWAKALERAGIPFLHGRIDDPMQQLEDGTTFLELYTKALDAVSRGSAIVTDMKGEINSVDITFNPAIFDNFAERIEKRIQMMILGQTLTSDVGDRGSYAAANVHDRVRLDKRDSDLALLQPVCQQLITFIWTVNEFNGPPPEFIFVTGVDLQLPRAERDDKLSQALARSGLRLSKEYFQRSYDLADEDLVERKETVLDPVAAVPVEPGKKLSAGVESLGALLLAASRPRTAVQTGDELEEQALNESPEPLPLDKVNDAIRLAKDDKDLEARLMALLTPEELSAFAQTLIRTYASARVAGIQSASR